MPHVSAIFVYPVKSLRGFAVDSAAIDALGIVGDRRFLVVDPAGSFLTQRSLPVMAAVSTALEAGQLILSAPGAGMIAVPLQVPDGAAAPQRSVTIWQSAGLAAEDCGDAVAEWLTAVLGSPARLVRAGAAFRRAVPERKLPASLRRSNDPEPAGDSDHTVAFPDAYPFMVLGVATLAELNGRLAAQGEATVAIERFRPSFVLTGSEAYAEDRWRRFQVGNVTFFGGGPCARCIVTNTDPWTGARGLEPLRLLASYRRDANAPTKINFGQNALHAGRPGVIRVGDQVAVLESEA